MNNFRFILIILFSGTFFWSCSESDDLLDTISMQENQPVSEKNKSMMNNLTTSRSLTLLPTFEGMLVFDSKEQVNEYYEDLMELSDAWEYEEGDVFNETALGDPAIKASEELIGFESLINLYEEWDLLGKEYRGDLDYEAKPKHQLVYSKNKEIAIGGIIYKLLPLNRIAVIDGLNAQALHDVRENGIHSFDPAVTYYHRRSGIADIGPGVGPGVGPNGCPWRFDLKHESGVGSDANLVTVSQRMGVNCDWADRSYFSYTIDWGDGSPISHSSEESHRYQSSNFLTGDCATFSITVTAKLVKDCGPCNKGIEKIKTFDITICPTLDECTKSRTHNSRWNTFNSNPIGNSNGAKNRLVTEIGYEGNSFPPTNFDNDVWAKSTYYKEEGTNSWKKTNGNLTVRVHGHLFTNEECLFPDAFDKSKVGFKKDLTIEHQFPGSSIIFLHKTGDKRAFADGSVETWNQIYENLNVPAWP